MAKAHDGSDFKNRQRILPHYQTMVLAKKRLKFTIILHLMIAFLMALKLVPTVLDLLNVFWQPIEELYVPMAQPWEWIWISSVLISLAAFKAIRTNNVTQLEVFMLAITFTCIFPLIYCAYLYSTDFRTYVITRDASKTSEIWRDYPVALYWYIFIVVAFQIHTFELYFGWELVRSMSNQRAINKSK